MLKSVETWLTATPGAEIGHLTDWWRKIPSYTSLVLYIIWADGQVEKWVNNLVPAVKLLSKWTWSIFQGEFTQHSVGNSTAVVLSNLMSVYWATRRPGFKAWLYHQWVVPAEQGPLLCAPLFPQLESEMTVLHLLGSFKSWESSDAIALSPALVLRRACLKQHLQSLAGNRAGGEGSCLLKNQIVCVLTLYWHVNVFTDQWMSLTYQVQLCV
jgi:hypothetical protein